MSQKQISDILGIGTSFISQIETGKDPMPGYIPEKLAKTYGQEEVDKYNREPTFADFEGGRFQKKYMFQGGTFQSTSARKFAESATALSEAFDAEVAVAAAAGQVDGEWIERVIRALERRDELASMWQHELERQGERIDILLSYLKEQ